jgi:hypothetical protein
MSADAAFFELVCEQVEQAVEQIAASPALVGMDAKARALAFSTLLAAIISMESQDEDEFAALLAHTTDSGHKLLRALLHEDRHRLWADAWMRELHGREMRPQSCDCEP